MIDITLALTNPEWTLIAVWLYGVSFGVVTSDIAKLQTRRFVSPIAISGALLIVATGINALLVSP